MFLEYYTDNHDVDEDLRTLVKRGGNWPRGSWDGITAQELYNDPPTTSDGVASYVSTSMKNSQSYGFS